MNSSSLDRDFVRLNSDLLHAVQDWHTVQDLPAQRTSHRGQRLIGRLFHRR